MPRSFRSLAVIVALTGLTAARPIQGQASAAPTTVSRDAFRSLAWLNGKWKGSGGGYAAFYEEYRVVNDSTIEQYEHPDSTFSSTRPRSRITWRNGSAAKGSSERIDARIVRIAGDTVRFESTRSGGGGFTWIRLSRDEWRAILDGRTAPVIYTLRRYPT